jgi:hypothetical protein
MGWSKGIVNGKTVGYSVNATCEHPGCKTKIDRGLAYACGGNHGDGDGYCDGYFCYEHLILTPEGQKCHACFDAWIKTPAGIAHQKKCDEIIASFKK